MIKSAKLLWALIPAFIYIGCGEDSSSTAAEEVSQVSSSDEMTDESSSSLKPKSSSSVVLSDSTVLSGANISSSAGDSAINSSATSNETSSASESADSSESSGSKQSSSSAGASGTGDLFSGLGAAGGFSPYWHYDSTKFKPLDPSKAEGCFQVYQDSLVGKYFSDYEEPSCVVKQTIYGLVKNLVNQGVALENAKATAMQKLYDFLYIDSAPVNDSLYEKAVGYAISTLFPVENGDTTMRVNFINDLANGKEFSKSDRCGLVVNSPRMIRVPWGQSISSISNMTSAIVENMWQFCGGLTDCGISNRGEFRKYDCGADFPNCGYKNREFICKESGWVVPTAQDY